MPRSPIEGNLAVNSDTGVLLPTYCEAANVEKLIQELMSLNPKITILVIDDSSPDGTAEKVRDLQRKYDNLLLLVRPQKSGLGTAITDGFKVFFVFEKPAKVYRDDGRRFFAQSKRN